MNYKKDFPIFKKNKNLVYLDSAATSQKPQSVINSILDYYQTYNANVRRGLYPISEKATARVEDVRKKVAKFINAKFAEEIIFVRNATEGLNLIAYSLSSNINSKDTITTTIMEHHSNFVPWQMLAARTGANFQVLDLDEREFGIKYQISSIKGSKILTLTHVSNVLGTMNPVAEILNIKYRIHNTILDAAQSVPHQKVDVQKLGCEFMVFSGHKMLAGTGIGVLYGKKEKLNKLEPFLYGGEMIKEVSVDNTSFLEAPSKFEAGTPDIAGIISLGAAIDYLENIGMANVQKHESRIMNYALEQMKKVQNLTIYGPENPRERSSVISFNLKGIHPHDIAQILGDMGICIRAGHHCAMPLHKRLGIVASARISFYIYNDEEDIDKFIKGLKKVQKIFKK